MNIKYYSRAFNPEIKRACLPLALLNVHILTANQTPPFTQGGSIPLPPYHLGDLGNGKR